MATKMMGYAKWAALQILSWMYVIVINQYGGLYVIYKFQDTRAKPEWCGFVNTNQCLLVYNYILYSPLITNSSIYNSPGHAPINFLWLL